jgi:uncharacterized membrane protein YadS
MLLDVFRWLEANLPGGAYLRESTYGFSILLALHVVFMCMFLGFLVMMDLRLAGLGHLGTRAADIQKRLFPWYVIGFVLVAITGFLLFYAQPLRYFGKAFFWVKMGLMAAAGVNAGVIHWITHRSDDAWDSVAARTAGAISLVLWAGVVIFGRLVAYEWMTTEYF